MKYRKKPVVIDAYQFPPEGDQTTRQLPPRWVIDATINRTLTQDAAGRVTVHMAGGAVTMAADDWLIRGVKGEIYPCPADVFAATYEPVSE
jgi:hypothetical protein